MRIASLVPSATDLVASLGLAERLVGVSHECDHPAARGLPALTRRGIPAAPDTDPAAVDRAVSEAVQAGESLYVADRARLAALRPDVVISQAVCDVCAVEGTEARRALPDGARLVMLEAMSLEGLRGDVRAVGAALDAAGAAERVVAALDADLAGLETGGSSPRLLALEWGDPPFTAGHWVPELIERAGAVGALGGPGEPSRRASWAEVAAAAPELVVYLPCGYHLDDAAREAEGLAPLRDLGVAVWAADATRLFSRCTPDAVRGGARVLADLAAGRRPPASDARRVTFEP